MEKINVAVTGVGGGVGQSIIKCLASPKYRLIGLDADFEATGLYGVARAYVIPFASDEHYIDALLKICKKEKCQFLFPGLDTELLKLSQHRSQFQVVGTTIIVSSPDVVRIADNKFETYEFLKSHGFPAPATIFLEDYLLRKKSLHFPLVIKPIRGGSRSVGVSIVPDKHTLQSLVSQKKINNPQDFLLQEYIDGEEYTCGTVNADGECFGTIIMRRILRDGDTYKCFVVRNKKIEKLVIKLMQTLQPFGPCNVQLRLKQETPYVFEINARCSGTTAARAYAGFNEPKMMTDYLLTGVMPKFTIQNISILRYWKELIVQSREISEMRLKKRIIQKKDRNL